MDNDRTEKTEQTAKKKPFIIRHWLICLIVLLIAGLFAFRVNARLHKKTVSEETLPVNVRVEKARLSDISVTSPLSSRITASEEVAIVPLAQGQVTEVCVSVGDRVSAGDLLFVIDSGAMQSTYSQAAAQYSAMASSYSRMKTLYSEGAVSAQDLEAVEAQYKAAAAAVSSAGEALSNYRVTAPIDGYITSLSVSVGSLAGGGMAGSIANGDTLEIKTSVSEALASAVHAGDTVEVYVSSLDRYFKGTITSFSPIPSIGTLTYPLTVTLEPDDALLAGMFAEVRLVSASEKDALCVSSNCVMLKKGRNTVVVLDENNIPTLAEVTTGLDNGSIVQILSGLSEGDTVVCSGQQYVTEGVAVTVAED